MTAVIKYMSILTTCSVFAALVSIVYQAFLSLKQLNKMTTILTALLALENAIPVKRERIAIGYGACTDLLLSGTEFLNFTKEYAIEFGPKFVVEKVNNERELHQTFAYYFQNGAAAERVMPNGTYFQNLIKTAKALHKDKIKWAIGGNAPLMGIRFFKEGADVLLGARMSHKLKRLLPEEIILAGDLLTEDDIHMILEYKSGDTWGPFTAPRANRYILHSDQNNPHLNSLEQFESAVLDFKPRLLVISGLQMMDSYNFANGIRQSRLQKVQEQISSQLNTTLNHFEMASYVEIELLQLLRKYILPYVDSIGMNEQELDNLSQVLQFGKTTLASDWNPRVATTLDHMRKVFILLVEDYYANVQKEPKRRILTRIHVHTLAYQALLTVRRSQWKSTKGSAAKASLTAHRYVCQTDHINPESATLILDESFSTSTKQEKDPKRVKFDPQNPVPCWDETISTAGENIDVEICVSPVLVCRVAKKTAGAGDNISAAGLSVQI